MFPLLNGTKIFKNDLFVLKFIFKNSKSSRFCFSISKKVAKNAVTRNKMRRVGYRLLKKYIPKIQSNTVNFFSFRKIPENNEEIIKNLESILKKSKLIK